MLAVLEGPSLTAAKPMKRSSSPSLFFRVFIESFIAKRAMSVQTTTARSIQETMFITVPRLAIGAVCRLCRACIVPRSISAISSRQVSKSREVIWRTAGFQVISQPTPRSPAAAWSVLGPAALGEAAP
jgi:hypothetical protein